MDKAHHSQEVQVTVWDEDHVGLVHETCLEHQHTHTHTHGELLQEKQPNPQDHLKTLRGNDDFLGRLSAARRNSPGISIHVQRPLCDRARSGLWQVPMTWIMQGPVDFGLVVRAVLRAGPP